MSNIGYLGEFGLLSLPSNWTVVQMKDLLSDDRGLSVGVMYPGNHDENGIPLIKAGDLRGSTINPNIDFRITPEKHYEYRRTALEGGELLLSLVGDIGNCAIVPSTMAGWNAARAIAVIRLKNPEDGPYIRLCLLSSPLQQIMNAWATTTVQATLNLKEIKELPIPLPPANERQAISEIIYCLDDKIEANRRMNETLEATARAIFKSWFVDFDPVHAKGNGEQPYGMDEATAALFPDSFQESELGLIPSGWGVKNLGDGIELAYGKSLTAESRADGSVPVYGSNGQVGWHNEKLVSGPGIVVGRKGNAGTVVWVNSDFFPIDTTFYVNALNGISYYFLYFELIFQDFKRMLSDSAVPGLNRNIAYMNKMLVPTSRILSCYENLAKPMFDKIAQNEEENQTLEELRDTMLPRLISGELRVDEVNASYAGGT